MTRQQTHYLALCGGVGGAKLALGLSRLLEPGELTIVVNTGDDFEHMGLLICPDIDTVTYTLAGVVHPAQGWGRDQETWTALTEVERLGGESWFRLGDRDLGLHLVRRELLNRGLRLNEICARIALRFGIWDDIVPMTDDPVRTLVETELGVMPFQHYFVKERCAPRVRDIQYSGCATPARAFMQGLFAPSLRGVIICPSNPFLSIDPILSLPGVRTALEELRAPVIAVSPIVGGRALKGPTAKIMQELGSEVSSVAVARHYGPMLNGFIMDAQDSGLSQSLDPHLSVRCCNTIMKSLAEKTALAQECLKLLESLTEQR